ncbi:mediator of RNA polymerase II transcription subunit 12-like isoform X2 [Penaeus indicus]|uniref:mediator of RNA polymerase II transcription subunit 12-like isoform X2 n=1 Tax=Penaeus indicus TaxID=29960 RepID=UPI00300D7C2F
MVSTAKKMMSVQKFMEAISYVYLSNHPSPHLKKPIVPQVRLERLPHRTIEKYTKRRRHKSKSSKPATSSLNSGTKKHHKNTGSVGAPPSHPKMSLNLPLTETQNTSKKGYTAEAQHTKTVVRSDLGGVGKEPSMSLEADKAGRNIQEVPSSRLDAFDNSPSSDSDLPDLMNPMTHEDVRTIKKTEVKKKKPSPKKKRSKKEKKRLGPKLMKKAKEAFEYQQKMFSPGKKDVTSKTKRRKNLEVFAGTRDLSTSSSTDMESNIVIVNCHSLANSSADHIDLPSSEHTPSLTTSSSPPAGLASVPSVTESSTEAASFSETTGIPALPTTTSKEQGEFIKKIKANMKKSLSKYNLPPIDNVIKAPDKTAKAIGDGPQAGEHGQEKTSKESTFQRLVSSTGNPLQTAEAGVHQQEKVPNVCNLKNIFSASEVPVEAAKASCSSTQPDIHQQEKATSIGSEPAGIADEVDDHLELAYDSEGNESTDSDKTVIFENRSMEDNLDVETITKESERVSETEHVEGTIMMKANSSQPTIPQAENSEERLQLTEEQSENNNNGNRGSCKRKTQDLLEDMPDKRIKKEVPLEIPQNQNVAMVMIPLCSNTSASAHPAPLSHESIDFNSIGITPPTTIPNAPLVTAALPSNTESTGDTSFLGEPGDGDPLQAVQNTRVLPPLTRVVQGITPPQQSASLTIPSSSQLPVSCVSGSSTLPDPSASKGEGEKGNQQENEASKGISEENIASRQTTKKNTDSSTELSTGIKNLMFLVNKKRKCEENINQVKKIMERKISILEARKKKLEKKINNVLEQMNRGTVPITTDDDDASDISDSEDLVSDIGSPLSDRSKSPEVPKTRPPPSAEITEELLNADVSITQSKAAANASSCAGRAAVSNSGDQASPSDNADTGADNSFPNDITTTSAFSCLPCNQELPEEESDKQPVQAIKVIKDASAAMFGKNTELEPVVQQVANSRPKDSEIVAGAPTLRVVTDPRPPRLQDQKTTTKGKKQKSTKVSAASSTPETQNPVPAPIQKVHETAQLPTVKEYLRILCDEITGIKPSQASPSTQAPSTAKRLWIQKHVDPLHSQPQVQQSAQQPQHKQQSVQQPQQKQQSVQQPQQKQQSALYHYVRQLLAQKTEQQPVQQSQQRQQPVQQPQYRQQPVQQPQQRHPILQSQQGQQPVQQPQQTQLLAQQPQQIQQPVQQPQQRHPILQSQQGQQPVQQPQQTQLLAQQPQQIQQPVQQPQYRQQPVQQPQHRQQPVQQPQQIQQPVQHPLHRQQPVQQPQQRHPILQSQQGQQPVQQPQQTQLPAQQPQQIQQPVQQPQQRHPILQSQQGQQPVQQPQQTQLPAQQPQQIQQPVQQPQQRQQFVQQPQQGQHPAQYPQQIQQHPQALQLQYHKQQISQQNLRSLFKQVYMQQPMQQQSIRHTSKIPQQQQVSAYPAQSQVPHQSHLQQQVSLQMQMQMQTANRMDDRAALYQNQQSQQMQMQQNSRGQLILGEQIPSEAPMVSQASMSNQGIYLLPSHPKSFYDILPD